MKLIRFSLLLVFIPSLLKAQKDTSIWQSLKHVESNDYVFSIPDHWVTTNKVDIVAYDYAFDMKGVGLPGLYNNVPFEGFCTIRKFQQDSTISADSIQKAIIHEFIDYSDRINGFDIPFQKTQFTVKTKEKGTVLHTRYYRKSKSFNYSRWDLLVHSKSKTTTYVVTFLFQYKDATYDVETKLALESYVNRVFRNFEFR